MLLATIFVPSLLPDDKGNKLNYTEFRDKVEAGEVTSVEVNSTRQDHRRAHRRRQVLHQRRRGSGPVGPRRGAAQGARASTIEFKTPSSNWLLSVLGLLLPFLLIIGFFVWMQRRAAGQMGNVMSIGRSRAKAYNTDKPSTTFADIAGYEGVKQEITEVVDFLRMPERFREIGARVPKGMLLVGPPGTGKTLFARAVAGEAGVGFLSVTGSDFMEMFVGVGASRVRDLFQQARKMGRAIIFIDEIDSIGRKRGAGLGGGHDEREQTLNQMLAEMDGFETQRGHRHHGRHQPARHPRPGAAAPRPLRPPDRRAVARVRGAPGDPQGAQPRQADGPGRRPQTSWRRATPGMSGADLANLVNEAALFAVRRSSKQIERIDFENARDRVVMGARRERLVLTAEEKRATAYHEGGHAVLATCCPTPTRCTR